MNTPLRVLFVSAEVTPFSKVGGLGDVAGALPKALWEHGVDARVITPLYGCIDREALHLRQVVGVDETPIKVGSNTFPARFWRSNVPGTRVQVFFIENATLFGGKGIYNDPGSGAPYWNNATRFIFFARAVAAFLHTGVFTPDLMHLNDNQAALVAPLLRTRPENAAFARLPLLLTIHNMEYQGRYPLYFIWEAGLDPALAGPGGPLEFYGDFNWLKSGVIFSDKITTVSARYAKETLESGEMSSGLSGVLQTRQDDFTGILNGVDYGEWNPETDRFLDATYSLKTLSRKSLNTQALLRRAELPQPERPRPVLGMISRLVTQKGLDILIPALDEILEEDLALVVLGTGQADYQQALLRAKERHPDKLACFLAFDESLAHQIEAASDFFLMPSRFEPCGLSQLYALRYGTIPIVHETGGLAETVKPFNTFSGEGWGFTFSQYTSQDLAYAIRRALDLYRDPLRFMAIKERAMGLDYSWSQSAKAYVSLYRAMLDGKP